MTSPVFVRTTGGLAVVVPTGQDRAMVVVVDSPIGPLGVSVVGGAVVEVRFGASGRPSPPRPVRTPLARCPPELTGIEETTGLDEMTRVEAVSQLEAYFAGELTTFSVRVEPPEGSAFERAVWAAISRIPYGEMMTYGAIAAALGDPTAARAVGTACNRNPVPIIVPCHRVVGAGGRLVGFGGGLDRKRTLLELEARVALQRAWG